MTQQRRDDKSTEYGLWTRSQSEIDSSLGYIATNIDWIWSNYNTGLWMMKEEKRYRCLPKRYQIELYQKVDAAARSDPNYRGFHIIVFQNTNPADGYVWLDGIYNICKDELIAFLRFELPTDRYNSYFPNADLIRLAPNAPI